MLRGATSSQLSGIGFRPLPDHFKGSPCHARKYAAAQSPSIPKSWDIEIDFLIFRTSESLFSNLAIAFSRFTDPGIISRRVLALAIIFSPINQRAISVRFFDFLAFR